MKKKILNGIMFGIFELFILFVAIFSLIATFLSNPVISALIFFFLIYFAYFLGLKYFFSD
jgi:hypothetical protein